MTDPMRLAVTDIPAAPIAIPGARGEFRIRLLNEDAARGVVTTIIDIPPGGFIPAHSHAAGSEMHYVLTGDLIEHGETLGPGAFLTHAAGVVRGPHESKGGASVLTVQNGQSRDGQFDMRLADAQPTPPPGRLRAEADLGRGYG